MIINVTANHKYIGFTLNFHIYLVIISKIAKEQIVNNVLQKI